MFVELRYKNKIIVFFHGVYLGTKEERMISPCHSGENFESDL